MNGSQGIPAPALLTSVRGIIREQASLSVDGGKTWTQIHDHERAVIVSSVDAGTVEAARMRASWGSR